MKKTIIALALLALSAGNIYALEGKGYKILSHKTECTGFDTCKIENMPVSAKFRSSSSTTTVFPAQGKINQKTIFDSIHAVNLHNTSNKAIHYRIELILDSDMHKRVYRDDLLVLQPGATYTNTYHVSATVVMQHPGQWYIYGTTMIVGAYKTGEPVTDSTDKNTLTITR